MGSLTFISVADVLELERETIDTEGGIHGVRDLGLLESAVAMPQQQFDEQYLHKDLAAMASAYLYHIASNHPFVDGNKRAAIITTYVFLIENGIELVCTNDELEAMVMALARGELEKPEIAQFLRDHSAKA